MDSDDEMLALLLEDEQAFDDDLREHLLIIASLQDMHDAEAEKRKRPDTRKAHVRWEPQEEGVMRTIASFFLSKKPRLSNQ